MKKVLILAGRFPPFDNPGARRPAGLYKYLGDFNWEAWVVTPDPQLAPNPYSYAPSDNLKFDESRVIRTNFTQYTHPGHWLLAKLPPRNKSDAQPANKSPSSMREAHRSLKLKLSSGFNGAAKLVREVALFPDPQFGWYRDGLNAARGLSAQIGFDAVISTSGPETCHLIAYALAREESHPIPWIADYRDLWSQKFSRERSAFVAWLDRWLEKKVLRKAAAITTVSDPFTQKIERLGLDKPVHTILNGFDPDDYRMLPANPRQDKLIITYAGAIYPGFRDPKPFLETLLFLINQNEIDPEKLEVHFFVHQTGTIDQMVASLGLEGVAKVYERIPRAELLPKLSEASVLWVLDWMDARETGNIPAKVYEYIGCRRFILATGGRGDSEVARLLRLSNIGQHAPNDPERLSQALLGIYRQFIERGAGTFVLSWKTIQPYNQRIMAKQFAHLLDHTYHY